MEDCLPYRGAEQHSEQDEVVVRRGTNDYLGLAHELKEALATYTESGGKGKTALDHAEAVQVMLESTRSAATFSFPSIGAYG